MTNEQSKANLAEMQKDLFGVVYAAIKSEDMATIRDCYEWIEGGSFDRHRDVDMCFCMVESIVESTW
jgi:hypothetical protein